MKRKLLLLFAFLLVFTQITIAQAESESAEEPPQWAADLRRAEIVAAGSFPLSLLASRLVYSLIRFAVRSIQAGEVVTAYAPWLLGRPGAPELEVAEKVGIVSGAVGLSSIIAILDYRLGKTEEDAGP